MNARTRGTSTTSRGWYRPDGPLSKGLLILAGTLVGVLIAELLLRAIAPGSGFLARNEMFWLVDEAGRLRWIHVLDPEFGFRPRLGDTHMNEYGTRVNGYPMDKRAGVQRLLFVGDSVTYRGNIIEALASVYGQRRFEYWNAGVDSFNTVQEVNFFKKFNAPIEPDHVVLTFHNNDFQTTPVAIRQGDRTVIYAPGHPLDGGSLWLYSHSYLFRAWIGTGRARGPSESLVAETEASLLEFQRLLRRKSIKLSVLLLPIFAPTGEWHRWERRSREQALRIFEEHGFRYFDLLEPLQQAISDGVDVQESPDDRWHPSKEAAAYFARYLHKEGLLSSP